jgi:hypothetical protein
MAEADGEKEQKTVAIRCWMCGVSQSVGIHGFVRTPVSIERTKILPMGFGYLGGIDLNGAVSV